MFTKCLSILDQLKADFLAISTLPEGLTITLDEPISLVYEDLPAISIYPLREEFISDESSNSMDFKKLAIRVELRVKSTPASTICTPIINSMVSALKADRTLGGIATYVEVQSIQWANDKVEEGFISGASIDLEVNYLTEV